MVLIPAFQLTLNERIERGRATVGRYDGKHNCLTCATTGGKIFVHSPHSTIATDTQLTYLNINKQITAVVAGQLSPTEAKDVLMVGTPTALQCYDVDRNRDMFFKEVPDGVNVVLVGRLGNQTTPMAIVGGNCSIQGFDFEGHESYWTVTGDNVSALCFADVDGDGNNELLVGSEDYDIRVFQNEDVLTETAEADVISGLCPIWRTRFGYALINGTIGVYDNMTRVWRVKSKHSVCAINSYDLDADGVPELISGWSNGRVEVRRETTGEVVYRDHLSCAVSSILLADYRSDGTEEVIVCGLEGEVKAYMASESDEAATEAEIDFSAEQAAIVELTQRKQEMLYELASYQANMASGQQSNDITNLIPSATKVESYVTVNKETFSCDLIIRTNNETVIRGVIIFGEQVFQGESLFMYPRSPEPQVAVPLHPIKDANVTLMIKVMVGTRTSTIYHVFELEIDLPKFAIYAAVERTAIKEPEGTVTFTANERIPRIANWVESRFNVKATVSRADMLEACFLCLRDKMPLIIRAVPQASAINLTIKTDNMDMAGDIVQDLANYMSVNDLVTACDFPAQMAAFKETMIKVDEFNATRLKLAADVADNSNLLKALVIKAEDSRILGDMPAMRKFYRQLYDLNRDLLLEHEKRAKNHSDLLDALKEVNQMIQRAARLRTGNAKNRVVNACRTAIKNNNIAALFKIIKDGDAPV